MQPRNSDIDITIQVKPNALKTCIHKTRNWVGDDHRVIHKKKFDISTTKLIAS